MVIGVYCISTRSILRWSIGTYREPQLQVTRTKKGNCAVPAMSLPLGISCSPPGLLGATVNQLGRATMPVISTRLLHDAPTSLLSSKRIWFASRWKSRKILCTILSSIGVGLPVRRRKCLLTRSKLFQVSYKARRCHCG